uniref:non-specific serine/threonine protein kinase n=1 Tax=Gouania willdenowi TaxID=441366 RepID=A0A8C5FYD9_GOUWI
MNSEQRRKLSNISTASLPPVDHEVRKTRKILKARKRSVQKKKLRSIGSLVCCEEYHTCHNIIKKRKKEFKAKYCEFKKIGIRRYEYKAVTEVALMAQAAGLLYDGSVANQGVIGLLDLYQLRTEILIVMELPLKSMDMHNFNILREGRIPEHEVKSIFKQLVDAAVLMHENGIFHRDIKAENVLVYLDQGNLSVKIIDFGCGDIIKNEPYTRFSGTFDFAPPEKLLQRQYYAEPTTVWQIGALLRDLYAEEAFETRKYMEGPNPPFDCLSHECNDFMNQCLTISPKQRPQLVELQRHPWLPPYTNNFVTVINFYVNISTIMTLSLSAALNIQSAFCIIITLTLKHSDS